jgi:hypothetical protein
MIQWFYQYGKVAKHQALLELFDENASANNAVSFQREKKSGGSLFVVASGNCYPS